MKNNIDVKIKKLNKNAVIPSYGTDYSCGCDLYACISDDIVIKPQCTEMIPTGISVQFPNDVACLIMARSGISCKRDLAPANKVGLIDSDYRGEIMVALHNHGYVDRVIKKDERIAQMFFVPYYHATFIETNVLDETDRNFGGFGSTGN